MSWGVEIVVDHGDGYIETIEVISGHTYNLTPMWVLSGAVQRTTREFDGMNCQTAGAILCDALVRAIKFKKSFELLNPENGWGAYEGFIEVLTKLAIMCWEHPRGRLVWNG